MLHGGCVMADAPAASAAEAIAGALVRHLIGWAGIWPVRNGLVGQETADSATDAVADYVLGALLAVGAAGWAAFRANSLYLGQPRRFAGNSVPLSRSVLITSHSGV